MPFIRFTETTYTIFNGTTTMTLDAYTNNGKVYSVTGNHVLLYYAFIDPSEFDEALRLAQETGNMFYIMNVVRRIERAESGLYVRFTIPEVGIDMEWFNWDRWDERQ